PHISLHQQRRLARAARWVLGRYGESGGAVRIDLLAVEFPGRFPFLPRVHHFPAAFGEEVL
ncbi:MAG: hypothetical protein V3T77_03125, partial [Planctomycetota bacterium]